MRRAMIATAALCGAAYAAYTIDPSLAGLLSIEAEAAQANAQAPVPATTPGATAQPGAPRTTWRVLGVGDIMMGSDWPENGLDPRITPTSDPQEVLGPELALRLRSADVVFGNVEGTIHANSDNAKQCGNPRLCFVFRSPPYHAAYLRRAGFTMVSNANNHSRDFGESNRAITYRTLADAGLAVSGADTPGTRIGVQQIPGGPRVALVAFGHNPGLLQVGDLARVTQIVQEAQRQADIVVVSCHIGAEGASRDAVTRQSEMFVGEDRGNPYRFTHTAVDAGADIVFCHGPHIPRAIEVYRGRFIAYSLGNFWTYGRMNLNGVSGLAPIADLEVDRSGALVNARILSATQIRPGGPVWDPSGAAARQIATLSARDFPESGITIAADGTVNWRR